MSAYFSTCSDFMKFITALYSFCMSAVMGTSSQRNALYLDVTGYCRDQPVDSFTDTMSDINYTASTASTPLVSPPMY